MPRHFPIRGFGPLLLAACLAAPGAGALAAEMPQAYSVAEFNAMLGQGMTMKVIRDGSKAMVDLSGAQLPGGALSTHVRTYYDLEQHRAYTLDLIRPLSGCSVEAFSGDWGDPFEMSAVILDELTKQDPRQTGNETVNGFATRVMEAGAPGPQHAKVWVDTASGLVIKAQAGAQTVIDVKQLSLAKPPAAILVPPSACATASAPVR
jgi:hypothetical protein